MTTFDVSCIGFCVLDILGRPVAAIPPGGQALIIDEIGMTVAGTAGATAVGCALLGLSTRLVTTLGVDDCGDFLQTKLQRYGVDCALVRRDGSAPTSSTILPVRPNGERPALHVPGSAGLFTVAARDLDAALDARIVHVGGAGMLKAFDGPPTLGVVRRAKTLGRTVTLDLIQAKPETLGLVEPLLPFVDYFAPSIEEASALSGLAEPRDAARFFQARGARNCLLTLGGDGVYVAPESGPPFHVPAFDIAVSDTTGCGDTFTSGVIAGLVRGWDLQTTARFASAVSAKVAMGLGSQGRLVSFEDTFAAMTKFETKPPGRSYAI
jgi:sugar/nucleoside kinase (ribokinase family)